MGMVGLVGVVGVGVLAPSAAQAATPSADVAVAISHSPSTLLTAADLTFTISGHNAGPDPATDVVLAFSFGYPLQFVSASTGCKTSYTESTSVLCSVGTLASGADATATVTVKPLSSGLYVVPVAASSTTADPDAVNNSGTDSVVVRPGPSQGERWVKGELPKILGRPADAGAITYWGKRFHDARLHYPYRLETVPLGIMGSNEYRRLRIRQTFTAILGRAASASDLTYWTAQAAKGLSYEAIERRLITSKEFSAKHGQDPADPTIAAYQVLLGRKPTQAEIEAFALDYANGKTFASIVLKVQRSSERYGRIVDARYQLALGHAPSALGRYGSVVDMIRGKSPELAFAQLLVSNEILAKYPPTQDDYDDQFIPVGTPIQDLKRYDFTH